MQPLAVSETLGTKGIFIEPFDDALAQWDDFVEQAEGSTFCHLAGWREIMTDVLGHECLYTVAKGREGEWQGVLPLVRVKSRVFGHYLVSMPFLNYGGPAGSQAARMHLAEQAVQEARQSNADLLELRSRQAVPSRLRTSHRKITVMMELPASAETLWRETLPAKLRSQIRRPRKEGMKPQFGADQVDAFYQVFARNMRDLGTPVLSPRLFEQIARIFRSAVVFGVVYWREQPVAAGCGFVWRDEFEMTWASSLREHNSTAPNMLLYWSFMEQMIARGVRVFNFGRCTPGGGTHRFKRQWGGLDVALPWAHWSTRGKVATPSPERPLFRRATAVWQRIPLPVANRLGPILARKLP